MQFCRTRTRWLTFTGLIASRILGIVSEARSAGSSLSTYLEICGLATCSAISRLQSSSNGSNTVFFWGPSRLDSEPQSRSQSTTGPVIRADTRLPVTLMHS